MPRIEIKGVEMDGLTILPRDRSLVKADLEGVDLGGLLDEIGHANVLDEIGEEAVCEHFGLVKEEE